MSAIEIHRDTSRELLEPFAGAMYPYGPPPLNAQWPSNIISTHALRLTSGAFFRIGELSEHRVEAAEMLLCRRASTEVSELMQGCDVGMGDEGDGVFNPFFIAGGIDDPIVERISASVIREKFNGIIFPPAEILVAPLHETTDWWSRVINYVKDDPNDEYAAEYLDCYRRLIEWFNGSEFLDRAFVSIDPPPHDYDGELPGGTESFGCVLPRLALGLTAAGSLIGVCGLVVHT